jgi:2-C-methyl-D-erythritol 4-phosphate cytidylyltransferase
MDRPTIGAIVLGAGGSTRMGGVDKLLAPLAGRPLLARTLDPFADSPAVQAIVVVASAANAAAIEALVCGRAKMRAVVLGGERRRDSVRAGLAALADCDLVLVHDGARPLVTADLIDSVLRAAAETGAALCAVPVSDTVKRANAAGLVESTLRREHLWLAQTPQAFRRDILLRAHEELEGDFTDDAAMVEALGLPVRIVMGSARNLKVTTPEDLELAAAMLGHGE